MQKTVYDDLCFKEKSYLCTVNVQKTLGQRISCSLMSCTFAEKTKICLQTRMH